MKLVLVTSAFCECFFCTYSCWSKTIRRLHSFGLLLFSSLILHPQEYGTDLINKSNKVWKEYRGESTWMNALHCCLHVNKAVEYFLIFFSWIIILLINMFFLSCFKWKIYAGKSLGRSELKSKSWVFLFPALNYAGFIMMGCLPLQSIPVTRK